MSNADPFVAGRVRRVRSTGARTVRSSDHRRDATPFLLGQVGERLRAQDLDRRGDDPDRGLVAGLGLVVIGG